MADETTETPTYKVTEDGRVLVPMVTAHPLAEQYAERCQADEIRNYGVGDTIFVSREWANALIDSGMVQIDPTDNKARQQALLLNRRNAPLTIREIEARVGAGETADGDSGAGGDADAATPARAERHQSAADKSAKSAATSK